MGFSKYAVPCLLLALTSSAWARSVEDDLRQFEDFKITYGRTYAPSEDVHRFSCFRKVMDLVDVRNAHGAETHGVNQFSDMCPEEFAKMYLGYKASNATANVETAEEMVVMAGQKINWADKGAVTPIKNQGQCGSCWSFSATGNMEGQWMLAGNTLIGLSEEELVQCSHNGDEGCRGGLMNDAFQWVITNGGINSEANYPYTSGFGVTGTCKQSKTTTSVAKISSFMNIAHNEDQMASWCFSNGPIAIAVDALSWQTYSGGIMSNCFGQQLDHGVLAVGFDDTFSTPYWIVKNSWGSSWGENGFIRLAKGSNQCGLKNDPSSSKI